MKKSSKDLLTNCLLSAPGEALSDEATRERAESRGRGRQSQEAHAGTPAMRSDFTLRCAMDGGLACWDNLVESEDCDHNGAPTLTWKRGLSWSMVRSSSRLGDLWGGNQEIKTTIAPKNTNAALSQSTSIKPT